MSRYGFAAAVAGAWIAGGAFAGAATPPERRTVQVAPDGAGLAAAVAELSAWVAEKPNVRRAADFAHPNVIEIAPGTYDCSATKGCAYLSVTNANLQFLVIRSRDGKPEGTVFRGGGMANDARFLVATVPVTVSGLTVDRWGYDCMKWNPSFWSADPTTAVGGGMIFPGGRGKSIVTNCVVSRCEGINGGAIGAGNNHYANGCGLIVDTVIRDCRADAEGAAVHDGARLVRCRIENCRGPSLFRSTCGRVRLEGCTVAGNDAPLVFGWGGAYAEDCTFAENRGLVATGGKIKSVLVGCRVGARNGMAELAVRDTALTNCTFVAEGPADDTLSFPSYEQEVTATFADEAEARRAVLSLAPLPDDAAVAICNRWDDSNPAHVEKGRMLLGAGAKGTFFLNGNPGGLTALRDLVRGSNGRLTFGNHTITHPGLGGVELNRLWREFMEERIKVEEFGGIPCVSFAFPYGPGGAPDALELFGRALLASEQWASADNPVPGMRQSADRIFPTVLSYMTDKMPSGAEFTNRFLKGVAKATTSRRDIARASYGIHSWCDAAGTALQGHLLKDAIDTHPEWAVMSDNEFAAYRYAYFNGRVERTSVNGARATYRVTRYDPARLGSDIALSLRFSSAPKAVEARGLGRLVRAPRGTWTLPHDAGRGLPATIARADKAGVSSLIPGVKLTLAVDEAAAKATVRLENGTDGTLGAAYVSLHLPPKWGDISRTAIAAGDIAAGTAFERTVDLAAFGRRTRPDYDWGEAYYAVGADFTQGGARRRLWQDAAVPGRERPSPGSRPCDAALTLGPVAVTNVDFAAVAAMSVVGAELKGVGEGPNEIWKGRCETNSFAALVHSIAPWGWSKLSHDKPYIEAIDRVSAACKRGTVRLTALEFESAADGEVEVYAWGTPYTVVEGAFLNGAAVALGSGANTLKAKKGWNRLIVRSYSRTCEGRYFRNFFLILGDCATQASAPCRRCAASCR